MRAPGGLAPGWAYNPPPSLLTKVELGSQRAPVITRSEVGLLFAGLAQDLERYAGEVAKPGQCWGFYARPIRGTSDVASFHGYGLAVDYDAPAHPLGKVGTWAHRDAVVNAAAHYGFRWGGLYSGRKDEMHFEYLGTPAQALAASKAFLDHGLPSATPTPAAPQTRQEKAFTLAASWPAQDANAMPSGTLPVALLRRSLNVILGTTLDENSVVFDGDLIAALARFQTFIDGQAAAHGQHGIDDQHGAYGPTTKLWLIASLQTIARNG